MKTEIISTGQEVLSGAVVDSNAAYIAQKLIENGAEVIRHTCVGDELAALADAFREAESRADCVIVSGGIGPTSDDLTAEAAAEATGRVLEFNEPAESSIIRYFKMKNMAVPESNRKQMLLPSGSVCMDNTVGTAPGFYISTDSCVLFFIPGVPSEMKHMMAEHVLPAIDRMRQGNRIMHRVGIISHFGIPEAEVSDFLEDIHETFPDLTLGLQAVFPIIHVKLYIKGTDEHEIEDTLNRAKAWVLDRTGHAVFSTTEKSMPEAVGGLLVQNQKTVALAESCTGGLMGHMLTSVPGSSGYFLFSGVTYSNEAKIKVLGVEKDTIDTYGAVSLETVREMADGARNVSGADYAIATSGIAGPDGGTDDKPVGTVCIGVASDKGTKAHTFIARFSDREKNKTVFAIKALDLLRRELLEI